MKSTNIFARLFGGKRNKIAILILTFVGIFLVSSVSFASACHISTRPKCTNYSNYYNKSCKSKSDVNVNIDNKNNLDIKQNFKFNDNGRNDNGVKEEVYKPTGTVESEGGLGNIGSPKDNILGTTGSPKDNNLGNINNDNVLGSTAELPKNGDIGLKFDEAKNSDVKGIQDAVKDNNGKAVGQNDKDKVVSNIDIKCEANQNGHCNANMNMNCNGVQNANCNGQLAINKSDNKDVSFNNIAVPTNENKNDSIVKDITATVDVPKGAVPTLPVTKTEDIAKTAVKNEAASQPVNFDKNVSQNSTNPKDPTAVKSATASPATSAPDGKGGGTLPKTGGIPAFILYGIGSLASLTGIRVFKKK